MGREEGRLERKDMARHRQGRAEAWGGGRFWKNVWNWRGSSSELEARVNFNLEE